MANDEGIQGFLRNLAERFPASGSFPPTSGRVIPTPDCLRGNTGALRTYVSGIHPIHNSPYRRRTPVEEGVDRRDAMRLMLNLYGVEATDAIGYLAAGLQNEPPQNTMPAPQPPRSHRYRIFTEDGVEVYKVEMTSLDLNWSGDPARPNTILLRGFVLQPTTPHGTIGTSNEETRLITVPEPTPVVDPDPDTSANLR